MLEHPVALVTGSSRGIGRAIVEDLARNGYAVAVNFVRNAAAADVVEALHRYVAQTPARLIAVSLADAVGDRRAQNQPGTDQEYPNWRVPLCDGGGTAVLVEDLPSIGFLRRLVAAVRS